MKKYFVLLLLVTFIANTVYAQEVDFSSQIRARSIIDAKDFNNDSDPTTFNELRTRLNAAFSAPRGITGFIQIQDSRIYGSEPSTLANTQNLDLHQAYGKISNIFGLPFDVKFGRMEVKLANERLVGAVGWSNVGRSFDGSILTYKSKPVDVHILGFQINESYLPGDSLDNTFGGIWAELKTFKNYQADLFVLTDNVWLTDNSRYTVGFYTKGNLGGFTHELEAAYQFGEIVTGAGTEDVASYMFAFNAGYNFEQGIKPYISAGIDYLSGDDNFTDGEYTVFNTLYATNHKFYGHMDYFINIPNHTMALGLIDLHAKCSIKPWGPLKLGANFHLLNSAVANDMVNGDTKDFGFEADAYGNFKYSENISFQGGISLFSPGDLFKLVMQDDTAFWGYGMVTLNL